MYLFSNTQACLSPCVFVFVLFYDDMDTASSNEVCFVQVECDFQQV